MSRQEIQQIPNLLIRTLLQENRTKNARKRPSIERIGAVTEFGSRAAELGSVGSDNHSRNILPSIMLAGELDSLDGGTV